MYLFPIKCYKICYNMLHNRNDYKTTSESIRLQKKADFPSTNNYI